MKRKNLIVLALFTSVLIVGTQVQASKTLPSKKAAEAEKCYSKEDRKKEVSCTNNVSMEGDTYINATRVQPEVPKSKIQSDWSSLAKTDITKDPDGVIYAAQKVFDNTSANAYEKSIAALMLSQAYRPKDLNLSTDYAIKAIEINGLDNNMHYQMMDMLSKFLFDAKRYEEALLYSKRYSTETEINTFDVLYFQGNTLYRLNRYAEAIAPLKKAYESGHEANQNLSAMLMNSYIKTNQNAEAEKISKTLAQSVAKAATANPEDKDAQSKLLSTYASSGQYEKAALLFDEMNAKGQITTANEYEAGYISYYNWSGHEEQTIKIINEGLAKKVIQESEVVYQLLGHANYTLNNSAGAIDAWTKGAALSANGEQNLLLAQIYREENEYTKSKAEAQKALNKGVKNKEQANKLLNQKLDE